MKALLLMACWLTGADVAAPVMGVVETPGGWRTLLGVRGNFLWGDQVDAPPRWRAGEFTWDGETLRASGAGRAVREARLAGIRGIPVAFGQRAGQLLAVTRQEGVHLLWRYDAVTLEARGTEELEGTGTPLAIDSQGRLWRTEENVLTCGDTRREMQGAVIELIPLADEWMVIRTAELWLLAKCNSTDLFVLPAP